jgi:aspartate 1-decarboxylase
MRRTVLLAKLHGIRVTAADLNYEGSIELDPDHMEAAGLLPFEFVDVWNKTTGARLSTYVIPGNRGSRRCVLNGAAARTCYPGDALIVAARAEIELSELPELRPRVLIFGDDNAMIQLIEYRWIRAAGGQWSLRKRHIEDR